MLSSETHHFAGGSTSTYVEKDNAIPPRTKVRSSTQPLRRLSEQDSWLKILNSITRFRKRLNKNYISYQIEICGKNNLKQWMKNIGFSSYNSLTRYLVWKKLGYLQPQTNLIDRLNILKKL